MFLQLEFLKNSQFINSELVGKTTDVFWGVIFPKIDDKLRHPSQLYEALLEGLILFLIMNFSLKKIITKLEHVLIFLIFTVSLELFQNNLGNQIIN